MDFRKFLALAERLTQGTTQAEWRIAVSRAYYAAFHLGGERLDNLGFRVPHRTEQSHVFVWRRWSNAGVAHVNAAGHDLNDLRSNRNRADYDKAAKTTSRDALDAVTLARKIIAVFDEIGRDERLASQVTEGIKKYERDVLKEVTWQR